MFVECSKAIFEGLPSLLKSGLFSDIAILVGSSEFRAHKLVLAAHSPYFLAMMTTDMRETADQCVTLPSLNSDTFKLVLDFMYTGCINLTVETVADIMYIADMLLMRTVIDHCAEFMYQNIDITNCVDVMLLAEAHNCCDLEQAALNFVCQNLKNVALSSDSFLDLPLEKMMSLLDMEELPCVCEEDVLRAALRWIVHDVIDRKKHAFQLLSAVRFQSITVRDLDNAMFSLPIVHDKAFAVVMASLRQDLASGSLFRNKKFSKPKRGSKHILVFGGANMNTEEDTGSTQVYRYDVASDIWIELENFKTGRYKHAVALVGNRVYLLGGNCEFFSITSSVECYNITTGVWTHKQPMLEYRKDPNVTVINGRMYVTSSEDVEDCSPMMEVYNPSSDLWSPYKSPIGWLPTNCSTSRVYNDKLYEWVPGNKRSFLRVTPLYPDSDPDDRLNIGVYTEADYPYPELSYMRHKCAMAFLGDHLYLVGGFGSHSENIRSDSIGRSVDRLNLKTKIWERVANMASARAGHLAEVVDGKLYVFGGQQDNSTYYCMEIYDPERDEWESKRQPVNFLFSAAVVY